MAISRYSENTWYQINIPLFSLWSVRSMKLPMCYVTIHKPAVKFQVGHGIFHPGLPSRF